MVDSIFNMPVENLRPEEIPGTPNAFQVAFFLQTSCPELLACDCSA